MSLSTRARLGAFTIAAIAALSACSSSEAPSSSPSPSEATGGLEIHDAWVKTADSGMTAAFADITNAGDAAVTIVSATSPASSILELHEVVDGVMRPKADGFVIPAGETLTLEPGGYHIMFMDVPTPIVAGDDVDVTITLDNGTSVTFTGLAKDFDGANEEYDGDMDMDMSSPSPSM